MLKTDRLCSGLMARENLEKCKKYWSNEVELENNAFHYRVNSE